MSDIWLSKMNNIVNAYYNEWDKYPFGSRKYDEVISALSDKFKLNRTIIEDVIYQHQYGYIDADDVDLGCKLGIDNPKWEHEPEAFMLFRAIHQLYAHDNAFYFERSGGYKSW